MIDARAVIDPAARLGEGVTVGPFSVIGPDVEIGAGCTIGPHVVIEGPTRIGAHNRIHAFAALGGPPQDKKYAGERSTLEIGAGNVIREYCTIHRGTAGGGGVTRIGDDNWIMAYVHIAHDCQVASHTVFSNAASLAGHVEVGDYAVLGGFTLVHQFCRIGAHSFTAMGSAISKDLPPFVTAAGNPARARGINTEGIKRRGFTPEDLRSLREAYRVVYLSGARLEEAIERLEGLAQGCEAVRTFVEFLRARGRSIVR